MTANDDEPYEETFKERLEPFLAGYSFDEELDTLKELGATFPEEFAAAVREYSLVDVAACSDHMPALEFLLAYADESEVSAALWRLFFDRMNPLTEARRIAVCERLLAAGANPNAIFPNPLDDWWGLRQSPLDLGIEQRSDAVALFCARELDACTVSSAISTAAFSSSLAASDHRAARRPEDRRVALELLKSLLDQLEDPTTADRWGTTAVHIVAYTGNVDALELLIERGAMLDAGLGNDVSFVSTVDRHLAKVGDIRSERVLLPAGSRPLDVLDQAWKFLAARLEQLTAAAVAEPELGALAERLEGMRIVRARLEAAGATRSGAELQRPAFAAAIDAILAPRAGETYTRRVEAIDLSNSSPWSYLFEVGRVCHEELSFLEPLAELDPVAYVLLGWHTRETLKVDGLYDDDDDDDDYDYEEDDDTVTLYVEDYADGGGGLLEEILLGRQKDDLLVLKREAAGTRLFRLNRTEVKDEGTLEGGLLAAFEERVKALS
jgi:hypothetical protein